MSTYLSLTNELLRRLGEVVMDSTEFEGARNVQALAKNAINSSIREILHSAQEWPFTLVTNTQTMVVGTNVYNFPSDFSNVDWQSFFLKKLTTNNAKRIPVISYTNYLDSFRAKEEASEEAGYSIPTTVFQTQESKFGVTPIPDDVYEIEYKYWSFPSDLVLHDDVCIIPDRFTNIVVDGAMVYMMVYRSNEQSAGIHKTKFEEGIRIMRRLLMDEPTAVVATLLQPTQFNPRVF